jgi:hypothetical protein
MAECDPTKTAEITFPGLDVVAKPSFDKAQREKNADEAENQLVGNVNAFIIAELQGKGFVCDGRCEAIVIKSTRFERDCVVHIEPDIASLIKRKSSYIYNPINKSLEPAVILEFPRTKFTASCKCSVRLWKWL